MSDFHNPQNWGLGANRQGSGGLLGLFRSGATVNPIGLFGGEPV